MSQQLSDSLLPIEDVCEQSVQFDQINVIQEYIPTPELTIQHEIQNLMEAVKTRIQSQDRSQASTAFLQAYGEIRREAYTKFNEIIKVYSGTKRTQYIILFYKDIDLQFEQLFNEQFPLKELYRREFTRRKNHALSRKTDHLSDSELVLKLLNQEALELVLDWHVLVDQIADALARCHLYQVISHHSFKELYNNINSNWGQNDTQISAESPSKGLESSIMWRLKNIFRRSVKSEEKNINAIDFKNLQNLISRMACQDIILGYLNSSQCQASTKSLIKVKGFLALLTQSLDSIKKNINSLIDKTLSSYAQTNRQDYHEDFENVVDQLVELEGNMTLFDRGFLKEYFKRGARQFSAEENRIEVNELEC